MADKVWKAAERRIAAIFNSTRTPLSGGNGKQTRSDTLHPRLFVETKYRKKFQLTELYKVTRALAEREGKLAVVALVPRGERPYLLLPAEKEVLEEVAAWMTQRGQSKDSMTPEPGNSGPSPSST